MLVDNLGQLKTPIGHHQFVTTTIPTANRWDSGDYSWQTICMANEKKGGASQIIFITLFSCRRTAELSCAVLCWAKTILQSQPNPAWFDFSLFNSNVQGHMLSTAGDVLRYFYTYAQIPMSRH